MKRPDNIDGLLDRLAGFMSPESRAEVDKLVVRPDDVFIATYSKCGTTWMQQVVHQLRSGAGMDFDEITAVVPWIEMARDMGLDPQADQAGGFRAFKTHLMASDLPPGARYITVFRDPATVLPSLFRFLEGWWFEVDSITPQEFAEAIYFRGTASGWHWNHFIDWFPRVGADDTLVLCYEDMVLAPNRVPALVADFLGLQADEETLQNVVRHCSRGFMAEHLTQFDDHLLRQAMDPVWELPPGGESSKVQARPRSMEMTPAIRDGLQANWDKSVAARLGFENYQGLRSALPNPLGVNRP